MLHNYMHTDIYAEILKPIYSYTCVCMQKSCALN